MTDQLTARSVIEQALTKRHEELGGEASPRDFDGTSQILKALEAAGYRITGEPAPGRWWICTHWLKPHNSTDAAGLKVAGPFRDQNEALESRARIERYTRGHTFFVDEEASQ